ncbi:MAG: sulfite exporter TauE/SafE family protein, partial [Acidobacteria bacterium]|nr:sulfite exporter TauE/SafE family protein [Acidobacteriota bacterium]
MTDVLFFVGVGFLAQMIDGALGMAYGVTSTTFLLSRGILPAQASAAVHASEMVTTLVSGISHLALRNVDMRLFKRLVIPGVIGAAVGAYVLSSLPGDRIRP